jgi:hypothetical protein
MQTPPPNVTLSVIGVDRNPDFVGSLIFACCSPPSLYPFSKALQPDITDARGRCNFSSFLLDGCADLKVRQSVLFHLENFPLALRHR